VASEIEFSSKADQSAQGRCVGPLGPLGGPSAPLRHLLRQPEPEPEPGQQAPYRPSSGLSLQ